MPWELWDLLGERPTPLARVTKSAHEIPFVAHSQITAGDFAFPLQSGVSRATIACHNVAGHAGSRTQFVSESSSTASMLSPPPTMLPPLVRPPRMLPPAVHSSHVARREDAFSILVATDNHLKFMEKDDVPTPVALFSPPPPPCAPFPMLPARSEDAFSILVATDNHLGFMEKDHVRRHDSFTAFEEICKLAQSLQVDFLLLGGDLFHDNKPSRATLVRTIDILRRYCLSDNPVRFQVVSDQTLNFPNSFGHVNYEDEHYNVGMPVFTVHGNHDDPAGIDNLLAVDILSSCNLVNYFGKSNIPEHDAAQITLHPVLLRKITLHPVLLRKVRGACCCARWVGDKGANRIALYGLGHMRDEVTLESTHKSLSLVFPFPPPKPPSQGANRIALAVRMTNTKKVVTVDESKFASFLDLVVWGHEHECRIEPQPPVGASYFISQPGSSVVTQLAEGEAKPKHVLHLRVQGNKFETQNIALTTPRPFEYAEVSLRDAHAQGVNARDPEELALFLSNTA
ncbi:unnamed protein product [Closterium sp. Yama58-4]|nr:unnamed protein product [Closterium sp. Yama58-4]